MYIYIYMTREWLGGASIGKYMETCQAFMKHMFSTMVRYIYIDPVSLSMKYVEIYMEV